MSQPKTTYSTSWENRLIFGKMGQPVSQPKQLGKPKLRKADGDAGIPIGGIFNWRQSETRSCKETDTP